MGEQQRLYGTILVLETVYRELVENPLFAEEAEIVRKADVLLMDKKICNIVMEHVSLGSRY